MELFGYENLFITSDKSYLKVQQQQNYPVRKFTARVMRQAAELLYLQIPDMFTLNQEFPAVLDDLFIMARRSYDKHILSKLDKISEMEMKSSKKQGGSFQQSFMSKMSLNLLGNVKSQL